MKFDHEEFDGKTVTGVFCRPGVTTIQRGQLSFDEIKILFGRTSILLSANIDTDETIIEKSDSDVSGLEDAKDTACLKDMLGRKLGWIWDCRNSQGYWDMLIYLLFRVGAASGISGGSIVLLFVPPGPGR